MWDWHKTCIFVEMCPFDSDKQLECWGFVFALCYVKASLYSNLLWCLIEIKKEIIHFPKHIKVWDDIFFLLKIFIKGNKDLVWKTWYFLNLDKQNDKPLCDMNAEASLHINTLLISPILSVKFGVSSKDPSPKWSHCCYLNVSLAEAAEHFFGKILTVGNPSGQALKRPRLHNDAEFAVVQFSEPNYPVRKVII